MKKIVILLILCYFLVGATAQNTANHGRTPGKKEIKKNLKRCNWILHAYLKNPAITTVDTLITIPLKRGQDDLQLRLHMDDTSFIVYPIGSMGTYQPWIYSRRLWKDVKRGLKTI